MQFLAIHTKTKKFMFNCYKCVRSGHRKSEFKFRKLQQKPKNQNAYVAGQNSKKSEIAFKVYERIAKNNEPPRNKMIWLIDSGTSDHLINQKNMSEHSEALNIIINYIKTTEVKFEGKISRIRYLNLGCSRYSYKV